MSVTETPTIADQHAVASPPPVGVPAAPRSGRATLGQQLIGADLITPEQLDLALAEGSQKGLRLGEDRKSTRLNSSHVKISYAVFCLKKKKKKQNINILIRKKKHKNKKT